MRSVSRSGAVRFLCRRQATPYGRRRRPCGTTDVAELWRVKADVASSHVHVPVQRRCRRAGQRPAVRQICVTLAAMSARGGFRNQYNTHGVHGFYAAFGDTYRNPHEPVICRALCSALTKWTSEKYMHTLETNQSKWNYKRLVLPATGSNTLCAELGVGGKAEDTVQLLRVHDLAAGSGEATKAVACYALQEGLSCNALVHLPKPLESGDVYRSTAVRSAGAAPGECGLHSGAGTQGEATADGPTSCGSLEGSAAPAGEVEATCRTRADEDVPTMSLKAKDFSIFVDASDPFTYKAYRARFPLLTCERFSFEDVEAGALCRKEAVNVEQHGDIAQDWYHTIVCCFALHLAEESRLHCLCTQLALACRHLVVVTPHKRPLIREAMGLRLVDEMVLDRVRVRLYRSHFRE